MKLVEFSVTNYRSITKASKITLQNLTVLVGKNNEGKSNLLNALRIAMNAMVINSYSIGSQPKFISKRTGYDWERDFPIQYQNRKSSLESIFKLHFRLEGDEWTEFHDLTKLRGNEDIPITVKIGKNNVPHIEVPKKGSPSYNKQSKIITDFISQKINFNYIPAIRTEGMAIEALRDAMFGELKLLSQNKEYVEARRKALDIENEILNKLGSQIQEPLRTFIPNLKKVEIQRVEDEYQLRRNMRDIEVLVDDGQLTSIANKGDGIKSLMTLAILKERSSWSGASVIAIEEPESHLHSGAIHSLIDVIGKISENSQVILTTHNPLFVQQNQMNSNILVDGGTARAAKNIGEIRKILGVLPSDNLMSARFYY